MRNEIPKEDIDKVNCNHTICGFYGEYPRCYSNAYTSCKHYQIRMGVNLLCRSNQQNKDVTSMLTNPQ